MNNFVIGIVKIKDECERNHIKNEIGSNLIYNMNGFSESLWSSSLVLFTFFVI